jgi:hypothetical protein
MSRLICNINKVAGWPTIREFGIKRLIRLTVESTRDIETVAPLSRGSYNNWVVFGRFLRFGLILRTPFTGTIREFGFEA